MWQKPETRQKTRKCVEKTAEDRQKQKRERADAVRLVFTFFPKKLLSFRVNHTMLVVDFRKARLAKERRTSLLLPLLDARSTNRLYLHACPRSSPLLLLVCLGISRKGRRLDEATLPLHFCTTKKRKYFDKKSYQQELAKMIFELKMRGFFGLKRI